MDLRYQSPHRPWGYWGLKSGILLRSRDKPDHKPDWDFYDNQDRYDIHKDYEIQKVVGHASCFVYGHARIQKVLSEGV